MQFTRQFIAIWLSGAIFGNACAPSLCAANPMEPAGLVLCPDASVALVRQEALMQRLVRLRGLWSFYSHGDQERAALIRLDEEEFILFQGLPGSEDYERQRLLAQIQRLGVVIWGARWASTDYLEDYRTLLQARPSANLPARSRRVVFIPWQIIPISYFIWWPVVPLLTSTVILILPNRESFGLIAALDISFDYFKRQPAEVSRYGKNAREASAVLAMDLLGLPQGQIQPPVSGRYKIPLSMILGSVAAWYFWFAGALLSNWRPEVVTAPVIPAIIVLSLLVWVVGLVRPTTLFLWQSRDARTQGRRARIQFHVADKLPLAAMVALLLWNSMTFGPGTWRFHFRLPVPFAPIGKIVRAFREGRQGRTGTDKPAIVHRVTTLVFPRNIPTLKEPKLVGQAKTETKSNEPENSRPQGPEILSEPPQLPSVTNPPNPTEYHPLFTVNQKLELVASQILEGTRDQLRSQIEEMKDISGEARDRLLRQFDQNFDNGGWTLDRKLRMVVEEPSSRDPNWNITYFRPPENEPGAGVAQGVHHGMVAVDIRTDDGKQIASGLPPSEFTDASGHELADDDFNFGRIRAGDRIFVKDSFLTRMEGLKAGSSVTVIGVKDLKTSEPLRNPPMKKQDLLSPIKRTAGIGTAPVMVMSAAIALTLWLAFPMLSIHAPGPANSIVAHAAAHAISTVHMVTMGIFILVASSLLGFRLTVMALSGILTRTKNLQASYPEYQYGLATSA